MGGPGLASVSELPGAADRGTPDRDGPRRTPARFFGLRRVVRVVAGDLASVRGRTVPATAERVRGRGAGAGPTRRGGRRGVLSGVPHGDRRQSAIPPGAAPGA